MQLLPSTFYYDYYILPWVLQQIGIYVQGAITSTVTAVIAGVLDDMSPM